MSRKRPVDKESHYKNIIQKQKTIIQKLQKQASRGNKASERLDDLQLELASQIEEEDTKSYTQEVKNKCPKCPTGMLSFTDLNVRKMFVCNNCSYRLIKK